MPDIPLLMPAVLNGVISKFVAPEELIGRTQLMGADRSYPSPDPVVAYDTIVGGRTRSVPNVPNSEAHIVKQLGAGHVAASMIYMRDKKVFSPTTVRWLRTPGSMNSTQARTAETMVMRELQDLDNRFERFAEFCIWQAFLTGRLQFTGGGVIIDVDYKFSTSHLPTVATSWGSTGATIIEDVQAWKRLISREGQAVATDIYLNNVAMTKVFNDPGIQELFNLDVKNQYLLTGQITNRIAGVTWHEYDIAYVDDNGLVTQYIPDNKILLLSNANPDRWYFYEGPSADHDAPEGHIGKFSKSWNEPDPSARQFLEEWHFFPGIWRPEQLVAATITA